MSASDLSHYSKTNGVEEANMESTTNGILDTTRWSVSTATLTCLRGNVWRVEMVAALYVEILYYAAQSDHV
jgi:hypothetical protein